MTRETQQPVWGKSTEPPYALIVPRINRHRKMLVPNTGNSGATTSPNNRGAPRVKFAVENHNVWRG